MSDYTDRVAAVTGAGSGNGKAIAETLLEEGARVALIDIAPDSLEEIVSKYPAAFAVTADVANAESVREAAERIEQEAGHSTSWSTMPALFGAPISNSSRWRSGTRSSRSTRPARS